MGHLLDILWLLYDTDHSGPFSKIRMVQRVSGVTIMQYLSHPEW